MKLVGVKSALLYSYLVERSNSDWISIECSQIEEDCSLTYKEQKTCVKNLKEKGLLETKLKGLPRKLYYKTSLLF